ncbi:MAG: translation initiation factor IF-2 [Spirochaetaceae bacterium]|nr:MAG: translation initiation factor IF-2 [Spirochaetaceae bacterium]
MADEQDKQKPKTTLIKHRKDESTHDDADKKRVRVVVRRKPAAKPRSSSPSEAPIAEQKPSVVRKGDSIPPSVREQARLRPDAAKGPAQPADSAKRPPADTDPEARTKPAAPVQPTARTETTTDRPEQRPTTASPRPRAERSTPDTSQEVKRNRFTVSNVKEPPPSVRESVRDARGTGQPGSRPPGPQRGGRPPFSGGRPGPGGPGGPPRSFRGPRPGGPPRPGAPGAGSTPPGDQKKPAGKKFFKSKKKDYAKRDRFQEREIQFKQKKNMPRANPVPKEIDIMEVITVSELARKMNLKASDLIGKLMGMGVMVTINQQIDADTATLLADEYGCKVKIVSLYDETIIETEADIASDLASRPPVVTIMGHVDHGKTKLLDTIRSTNVIGGEFGGITQHIGAYQVPVRDGRHITFLDTPGHAAFSLMRARGAQVTDIVVLVVAANDGVMPQTREAIEHAKAAKVPIIVAVNKIDLPDANPDRVKQQLSDLDLMPEEWGGSTLYAEISALKGDGIPELLDTIMLQADVLELKANHDREAEGAVIESKIDPGRGTVCTVLIERGTLRVGDSFVAGVFPGRVRTMFNDLGKKVDEAGPAMPVEVLGFTGVPKAGDPFQVTTSEKLARQVGSKRQELRKVEQGRNVKKVTLDNLYDSIQEGAIDELRTIIKGDVHGSVEALQASLERLSTGEIRLAVLRAGAGAINDDDVRLAAASDAIIIGFHVRPTATAQQLADQEKVEIRKYNIIYDVVDDIRNAMEGMLAPDYEERTIGTLEVRNTFKVPKVGVIAGSYVTSGLVRRNAMAHLLREGVEIHTGKITSLKRFKDDAREVESGYECGVGIDDWNDIKEGDTIEVFEMIAIAKTLGASNG